MWTKTASSQGLWETRTESTVSAELIEEFKDLLSTRDQT